MPSLPSARSFQHGRVPGRDIHREGSGNPGATNTYRVAGPGAAALVAAVGWGVLVKATGRASLASIVVTAILPLVAVILGRPRAERLALAAVAAIIVVRHRDNIARLRTGQEPPLTVGFPTPSEG